MSRPESIVSDALNAAYVAKDQSFRALEHCAAMQEQINKMQKQIDTLIQRLAFVTYEDNK